MKPTTMSFVFASIVGVAVCAESQAGVSSALLQKTVQTIEKKFGREIVEEFGESGSRVLAQRIESLAAKHGDELVTDAVQKVGPQMFRYLKEVGEDGTLKALKLMRRTGSDSVWVISQPGRFRLFFNYGDDAADAMIKHGEIVENIVSAFGTTGAQALKNVSGQSARRLAILSNSGALSRTADPKGILRVVAKYGDRAAAWVWRNKGALAVVAVAASFVKDPEPYLSGAKDVGAAVGKQIVQPAATAAANSVNWNMLASLCVLAVTGVILMVIYSRRRKMVSPANG